MTAGWRWVPAVALPLSLLLGLTLLHARYGINLVDEGFLWYGAQRTVAGQFPLADFQSLDFGRYIWTAFWMRLFHDDGILMMRYAAALYEAPAVAALALVTWRQTRSLPVSLLAGVNCVLWICPWQGRYEPSTALLEVAVFALLAERPTDFRFLLSGIVLGFAWVFGRHLGLYGTCALVILLWALRVGDRSVLSRRRVWRTLAGFGIAYWPAVAAEIWIPNYSRTYWGEYMRWIGQGATNAPLTIPWPWRLTYGNSPLRVDLAEFFYGAFFLVLPVFGICVLAVWILRRRPLLSEHPTFFAAAVLSIPFAHGALARADLEHLLRYGAPVILGITLLPLSVRPLVRVIPGILLGGVILLMLHVEWETPWTPCQEVLVGRDRLCVGADEARLVEGSRRLVQRYVRPGESVLVIPYHVGLYPALGLVAPTWETFAFGPRAEAFERAEIARIERARTRAVLAYAPPLDGRPELLYAVTHPWTSRHLRENFELVPQEELPATFGLLLRRGTEPRGGGRPGEAS